MELQVTSRENLRGHIAKHVLQPTELGGWFIVFEEEFALLNGSAENNAACKTIFDALHFTRTDSRFDNQLSEIAAQYQECSSRAIAQAKLMKWIVSTNGNLLALGLNGVVVVTEDTSGTNVPWITSYLPGHKALSASSASRGKFRTARDDRKGGLDAAESWRVKLYELVFLKSLSEIMRSNRPEYVRPCNDGPNFWQLKKCLPRLCDMSIETWQEWVEMMQRCGGEL